MIAIPKRKGMVGSVGKKKKKKKQKRKEKKNVCSSKNPEKWGKKRNVHRWGRDGKR